ncbi:MAG: hypothetical protein WBK72_06405, partial [Bacillota bacterium]
EDEYWPAGTDMYAMSGKDAYWPRGQVRIGCAERYVLAMPQRYVLEWRDCVVYRSLCCDWQG